MRLEEDIEITNNNNNNLATLKNKDKEITEFTKRGVPCALGETLWALQGAPSNNIENQFTNKNKTAKEVTNVANTLVARAVPLSAIAPFMGPNFLKKSQR